VLAGIGELRDCRILDVGCGLGDFAQWLAQHDIDVHYTGLDVTPAVIERAKRRLPQGRFFQGDILSVELPSAKFDYVFCSGIFTHRRRNPKAFFHASIRRMFELCRAGVAFNCLSAWAARKETREFHADPLETLRFCRTLTQWVTLRHDYHPGDFTIYLYRRPR
jgi:ubiquinone/menaquinone biosynthesis C-methylase UbiE